MMCYKDKTFCPYEECVKHSPEHCNRVLTDYDLKQVKVGKWLIAYYTDKPECYFSGKGLNGRG